MRKRRSVALFIAAGGVVIASAGGHSLASRSESGDDPQPLLIGEPTERGHSMISLSDSVGGVYDSAVDVRWTDRVEGLFVEIDLSTIKSSSDATSVSIIIDGVERARAGLPTTAVRGIRDWSAESGDGESQIVLSVRDDAGNEIARSGEFGRQS